MDNCTVINERLLPECQLELCVLVWDDFEWLEWVLRQITEGAN